MKTTKKTLLNEEQMHHKMKTIRSQRHQLGSNEINKVSLSCFDDKRYIHDNGTSSYAYGTINSAKDVVVRNTLLSEASGCSRFGGH